MLDQMIDKRAARKAFPAALDRMAGIIFKAQRCLDRGDEAGAIKALRRLEDRAESISLIADILDDRVGVLLP